MEQIRLKFLADTTQFAKKWFLDEAKAYCVKYPEIVHCLKKEEFADLKQQVNDLVKDAGRFVEENLSNPNLWWHLEPKCSLWWRLERNQSNIFSQYELLGNSQVGYKFPEKIDRSVRYVLGELGIILEQHGFKVTTSSSISGVYCELWFCNIEGEEESQPYYPQLFDWSEDMKSTMQQYNSQFKKAILLLNEIHALKEKTRSI
jgi:hypothetical protein